MVTDRQSAVAHRVGMRLSMAAGEEEEEEEQRVEGTRGKRMWKRKADLNADLTRNLSGTSHPPRLCPLRLCVCASAPLPLFTSALVHSSYM